MPHQTQQHDSRFPTTNWTMVEDAGNDQAQGRPVLSELLLRYLPAMKAHLVFQKRMLPDQADELLQAFIAKKILEQNLLAQADRSRGCRFRSFLLTVLDRFVSNQLRSERASARSHSLSQGDIALPAESRPPPGIPDDFDAAWARQVIYETLDRMQAECHGKRREDIWEVFAARVLRPALYAQPPVPYADLVRQFAFQAPVQASMILATGKRMFDRLLRRVVGEYAPDASEIEMEVGQLLAALSTERSL